MSASPDLGEARGKGLRYCSLFSVGHLFVTSAQLMAWFGWSSISQAQVYTRAASSKVLSRAMGQLITGTGVGSPINPVSQIDDQDLEKVGGQKMNWRSQEDAKGSLETSIK